MHATILPLIAALLSFTPRTLALPTTQPTNPPATLLPRTDFCYNAPDTEAGTSTYLHITYAYAIKSPYIELFLSEASAFISFHISALGDGLLPSGVYERQNYGLNRVTKRITITDVGVTGAA
ncbi:MAG: hypothetical protein FRX48_06422 [Lasallia pustulata]|uniref:Uncharacterized protein n=1 Tax=Lasallia pustulata TaxID=136370 RepID=A0A5M8PL69_9LECA|nr:MAG: hypothetical protein FRX48_06422 [Lasallia pustulata]